VKFSAASYLIQVEIHSSVSDGATNSQLLTSQLLSRASSSSTESWTRCLNIKIKVTSSRINSKLHHNKRINPFMALFLKLMVMECSHTNTNSNSNFNLNINSKISWGMAAVSSNRLEVLLVLEMPTKISTMALELSNQWDMLTMVLINHQMKKRLL
jgi:hypothetical protein